ncbi:DMT family transporter [Effusibacillus pohliae]|uniref:DMT family transporter n=1 Tax=Effusibacillus pohliae TaxID=232270 RepID=UPI000360C4B2|nr:DMT family transporter [Effusibacillus pohliae]
MREDRAVKALLAAVVVIWGLNVVMVKFLVGHFPPITLAAVRIGAATLLLLAILVWWRGGQHPSFRQIPARSWLYIIGAGVSAIFLHQTTLAMGLQTANASTGSLILALNPLVTGLLAYFLFREPLTWNRVLGLVMGFSGVFLVVAGDSMLEGNGRFLFGKGEWLVVAAMLFYVAGGLFVKKAAETVSVVAITAYMHAVGTLCLAVASVFETQERGGVTWPADWFVWTVLLFSAWVATGLCGIWWNNGIQKIGAGRTAMFLNGMPAASLVFAVLLLGERMIWIHAVGFVTVLIGVYLGTMNPRRPVANLPTSLPSKQVGH